MENITQATNSILLEEEEDRGIAIKGAYEIAYLENAHVYNVKLCLVERFLIEGVFDFEAMKQTMAAL